MPVPFLLIYIYPLLGLGRNGNRLLQVNITVNVGLLADVQ
jgi:hypothetical protein